VGQAVSHQLLTAEAQVRALVSPCGICDGQSGTKVFLRVLWFSPSVLFHHGSLFIYHPGDE
jgi:hypothetical protein